MLYSATAPVMSLTAQSDANMDRESKPYILKRTPDQDHVRKFSLDYAKELNAQQYAAVTAADGPALVIAGAGKAFCAGHDLKEMRADPSQAYYERLF